MSGNRFYPRPKQRNNSARAYSPKTAKQMEHHLKGVANHRRIEILFLISSEEGINLETISSKLRCNFKTISEHVRKLVLAGLVDKKYKGLYVEHRLSPYGKMFVNFLTLFSNSAECKNS